METFFKMVRQGKKDALRIALMEQGELMFVVAQNMYILHQKGVEGAGHILEEIFELLGQTYESTDKSFNMLLNSFREDQSDVQDLTFTYRPGTDRKAQAEALATQKQFLKKVYLKEAEDLDNLFFTVASQHEDLGIRFQKENPEKRKTFARALLFKSIEQLYGDKTDSAVRYVKGFEDPCLDKHLAFITREITSCFVEYFGEKLKTSEVELLKKILDNEKINCSTIEQRYTQVQKRRELLELLFAEAPLTDERRILLDKMGKSASVMAFLGQVQTAIDEKTDHETLNALQNTKIVEDFLRDRFLSSVESSVSLHKIDMSLYAKEKARKKLKRASYERLSQAKTEE